MVVERSRTPNTGKKAKAETPGKEVATCNACRELVAAKKAGKGDGPYCKIHQTNGHDLQECHQVEQLVKKQRVEYEKRDKEKGQNGAGRKGRGGEVNHLGKAPRNQVKPARGRGKEDCNVDSEDGDE